MGIGLASFALLSEWGHIGVGWTMTPENMLGGSLRLLFSFSAGMLMARSWHLLPRLTMGSAFTLGAAGLVLLTAMPRIGGEGSLWLNGIYDSLCAIIFFPLILYIGGQGELQSTSGRKLCQRLGDLSYPLYLVHYPFLYLYFAWVKNNELTFWGSIYGAMALFFGSILLAYLCMKLYDAPLRRWLTKKYS